MHNCFFVVKSNGWKYNGPDSLKSQRLGIIQGYGYPSIQSYIEKNVGSNVVQAIAGENALLRNIKKLMSGRITTVLEDEAVFKYAVSQIHMADRFIIAGDDETEPEANNVYIAFTPEENNPRSAEYAKALSDGMTRLRANGKLAEILSKYGLNDWR